LALRRVMFRSYNYRIRKDIFVISNSSHLLLNTQPDNNNNNKKKKNTKASFLRPKTPASEPERTKKDFISLQGLLLLLFIINFSLLFSIFDLQNQRQSSICPFPFLNFLPVSLSLFSPLTLRYLQTLGFCRGY
jgi:hypothetical protein